MTLKQLIQEEVKSLRKILKEDRDFAVDLMDTPHTFSNWVKENSDWIKEHPQKNTLLDRISHLKDEGINISPEKVEELKKRITAARNMLQLYGVFYNAMLASKNAVGTDIKNVHNEALEEGDTYVQNYGYNIGDIDKEYELEEAEDVTEAPPIEDMEVGSNLDTKERTKEFEVGDLVQWIYIPKWIDYKEDAENGTVVKGKPRKMVGVIEAILGGKSISAVVKVKVKMREGRYKDFYPLLKKLKKKI